MAELEFVKTRVYPRVGGGNEYLVDLGCEGEGLSPRGRGKHPPPGRGWRGEWSIPAWAGETPIFATRSS